MCKNFYCAIWEKYLAIADYVFLNRCGYCFHFMGKDFAKIEVFIFGVSVGDMFCMHMLPLLYTVAEGGIF